MSNVNQDPRALWMLTNACKLIRVMRMQTAAIFSVVFRALATRALGGICRNVILLNYYNLQRILVALIIMRSFCHQFYLPLSSTKPIVNLSNQGRKLIFKTCSRSNGNGGCLKIILFPFGEDEGDTPLVIGDDVQSDALTSV